VGGGGNRLPSPVESRDKALVKLLGDDVPLKLKRSMKLVYRIFNVFLYTI